MLHCGSRSVLHINIKCPLFKRIKNIQVYVLLIFTVIYVCEYDQIRQFMVRACLLGMCNGDFVFVYTWLLEPSTTDWQMGDEYDDIAKEGFKYVIHVSMD